MADSGDPLADLLGYRDALNSGTAVARRSKFNFVGLTATDNPTLGATDISITSGIGYIAPVRVATTANHALSGLTAIDGVTPIAGDRVLAWQQTAAATNGIYVAAAGAWARAADYDDAAEVVSQSNMAVEEGTLYAAVRFVLTTPNPITVGSTALVFAAGTALAAVLAAGPTTGGTDIDVTAGDAMNFLGELKIQRQGVDYITSTAGIVSVPGALAVGSGTVASAGDIRLARPGSVRFRNEADTGDIVAVSVNTSGVLLLGDTANTAEARLIATSSARIYVAGDTQLIIDGSAANFQDNNITTTGTVTADGMTVTTGNVLNFGGDVNIARQSTTVLQAFATEVDLLGLSTTGATNAAQVKILAGSVTAATTGSAGNSVLRGGAWDDGSENSGAQIVANGGESTGGGPLDLTGGDAVSAGPGGDVSITGGSGTTQGALSVSTRYLDINSATLDAKALNITTTGYLAIGSDPADTGAIRLSNGATNGIYGESSPAGTDLHMMSVDSSEALILGNNTGDTRIDASSGVALYIGGATEYDFGATAADFKANDIVTTGGIKGGTGGSIFEVDATGVGFYNTTPVARIDIVGSRGGNAALADFLTKVATTGFLTDSTT